MRLRIAIGVGVIVVALGAVSAPAIMELQTISETKDHFLLESAVADEAMGRAVNRPSADEFLNPRFMQKYNLNADAYLDSKGYFSPNGSHWKKWSTETKTAAILMWREKQAPSVLELRRIIHRVNEYYEANDLNIPVVEVFNAAAKQ